MEKGEQGDGGLGQEQTNRDLASEDSLCLGITASPGLLQSSSPQFVHQDFISGDVLSD